LRNDYFEYLFEKFGDFGYLFDTIDEMADAVEKIVSGQMKGEFNFEQIKNNFSPESISRQMKNEFGKIKFINREN
jgi:glycosyltransferase involved in cell wall biosynthesis